MYGFEDLAVECAGARLPLFHTRSPLLGSKLSSAVFNSYAGPLAGGEDECAALVERAVALAEERRVHLLEIKCLFPLPGRVAERCGLRRVARTLATAVPLGSWDAVAARQSRRFRKHARAAARRVAGAGIAVGVSRAPADLARFHELLVREYRDRHLMLAQPWRLFERIERDFLREGRGELWVARGRDGALLGGHLYLHQDGTATGAFGAVDARCRPLSLDTVMKQAALRAYCERGFRVWDLGVTSPRQPGLLFAKSRFGGTTFDTSTYYRLVRAARVPDVDFADAYMALRRPYRYVPVPLARLLSSWLVPYLN